MGHTAIWTGREMVVWGGLSDIFTRRDGGRYNPISDAWRPVSTATAPLPRYVHVTAWTGAEMIVWGGDGPAGLDPTGGRYLIDSSPDSDQDSFSQCGGDCDDANASVYPAAPQICDGVNNDCTDPSWPAVPQNEADGDQDGLPVCAPDCNDGNASVWSVPGEVRDLSLTGMDSSTVAWLSPQQPGATSVVYDLLRSALPGDFVTAAICVVTDSPATTVSDPANPALGSAFYYLARAINGCPGGEGSLGSDSTGSPRPGRGCPDAARPPTVRPPILTG